MSNNQQQQPSKNYQYASTTPSVSSLLNLPQVQDKKKPVAAGLAGGLAAKPVKPAAAMGLAPSAPLGTLKLKKPQETTVQITETKEAVKANSVSTGTETTVPVKSEPAVPVKSETTSVVKLVKSESAVVSAKVEKPKTEKHLKQTQNNQKNTQTQTSVTPNDYFDPSHWRLFVGNLGPEVSDSLLLNTFKNAYPSTSKVLLVRDWKTQKSKGYAFVAFADGKEFLRALKEMNGKWIGNRQCIIKKSEHQPKFQ